jgi:hypothetical protein
VGLAHNGGPPLDDIPHLPRLLYDPAEVEQLLGISHSTLYRLLKSGSCLDGRRIGGKRVITAVSIERFIAGLPAAVGAPRQPELPASGKMGPEGDGKGSRPRRSQSQSLRHRRDRADDPTRTASSG